MLDLAVRHAQELQFQYLQTVGNDFYQYYRSRPNQLYFIPLADDNGQKLQYVSVDSEGVAGYVACDIDRLTRTARNLEAIRFRRSPEYSADLFRFMDLIFNRCGMDKVIWDVIVGNPAEKFFDFIAETYGTRIVGTFHQAVMMQDGRLYDSKYYEFWKQDFMKMHELGQDAPYIYKGGAVNE